MSTYRDQLNSYLKNLDVKTAVVFDVGGAQLPVQGRTKSWEVGEYKIIDLPHPHEGPAPDICLDLEGALWSWQNYRSLKKPATVVFCLEVFEYLSDPLRALRNLNRMLLSHGKLYVTFPAFYPPHNPVGADCLRYTKAGIVKMLEKTGFSLSSLTERVLKQENYAALREIIRSEGLKCARGHEGELAAMGYIVEAIKT